MQWCAKWTIIQRWDLLLYEQLYHSAIWPKPWDSSSTYCLWRIALGAFQFVIDVCKCAAFWFGFHQLLWLDSRIDCRWNSDSDSRWESRTDSGRHRLAFSQLAQPEMHLGALSCLLQLQYYYYYYFVLSKASATNCPSVRLSSDKYTSCHACTFSAKSIVRSCHILKLSVRT